MKPSLLAFRRAASIEEAITLISGHAGFAKFLAGGQTLGPMINLRLVQPDLVVDISRLDALHAVAETGDRLRLGAAVTHAEVEDGLVPDVTNGLMRRVASGIAYRAIRNRGTIGGSLAHADPSAEWPTIMLALGARILVRGPDQSRQIESRQFIYSAMTTALADNELIEAVDIPRLSRRARWGFVKRCRKLGEFAHALAVVVLDPERRLHSAVIATAAGAPIWLERTSRVLAEHAALKSGMEIEIRSAYEADLDSGKVRLDDYDRHVIGLALLAAVREAQA